MAILDSYKNSTLGLKGNKPTQATYPNHVFDPKNDPNKLALSDEITILYKSNLDLDGKTIKPRDHKNSTVHVKDNELAWSADRTDDDLKGETIKKYPDDYGIEGLLRLDFPS